HVITRYRDSNQNLRTTFLKVILRAGLTPWPRLIQNLRASRETELAARFPLHVVTQWLGNSNLIAAKHYLTVRDEDFAAAVQIPAQRATEPKRTDISSTGVDEKDSGSFISVYANSLMPSDPDGIRTRVAALKGLCPRPLDDRANA